MRVFIIECPNPIDLLQGRNEGKWLEQICKLVGHEVISFQPKSKNDLLTVLSLIRKAKRGCIHYYRWSTKKRKYKCYS